MPHFTPENEELSPEPTEKGVFATDKTDNNWTNLIFLAPTKTGPGKKPPRFANRYLDIYPDIGIAKNNCPKGLTVGWRQVAAIMGDIL